MATRCGRADAMVTDMLWELLKLGVTKPGVDYCRPGMNLFDPGFREPGKLRLDDVLGMDGGNDPQGVIDRFHLHLISAVGFVGTWQGCTPPDCYFQKTLIGPVFKKKK
jgi:hypothetical protein